MRNLLKSVFGGSGPKHLTIEPAGQTLEIPKGQTLLEAALAQGIQFPHDCTVGTCGSCRSRLVSGEVRAITDFGYTLSREELEAGYILACQALPKNDVTLEVEIQDALPEAVRVRGRIVEIEDLTHDIKRVTLGLDGPVPFVAGQYANLEIAGIGAPRSYSFADAPDADGLREISFFIRKVPGGAFTEALFRGEFLEKPITLDGPHGGFHLREGKGPMLCIAGGSGLAPVLSLLKAAVGSGVSRPCTLLFGARSQQDLYAHEEIRAIGEAWNGPFAFEPVLSEEPAESAWPGKRGLVTECIAGAFPDADWTGVQGYMCGPPPMIDAGIAAMTELGTPLSAIFYDKFTDASHEPRA